MWIDDVLLERAREDVVVEVWVPQRNFVVLGRSNVFDVEAKAEVCQREKVTVLKRYGGGGTVVLYPGCLVLSAGVWVRDVHENGRYFDALNQSIIDGLEEFSGCALGLVPAGISDIATEEGLKIAGTSMFRSRNYLLFQASVLCRGNPELIESLLKHPSKEPDYREGRSHRQFMGDLESVNPVFGDVDALSEAMKTHWVSCLRNRLEGELVPSKPEQIKNLVQRLQRKEGVIWTPDQDIP